MRFLNMSQSLAELRYKDTHFLGKTLSMGYYLKKIKRKVFVWLQFKLCFQPLNGCNTDVC